MKYTYQFFIVIIAVVSLSACTKNLNQSPESTATHGAVFGSEDGLKLYTYSFYNDLPDINTLYKTDCNLSDFGAVSSVPDYIRTGAYSSRQSSGWTWTVLRNINYFIANCTDTSVAQSVRENYIGLAKFFRAYFYFRMMQRFGDLPWYSAPLSPGDSTLLYKPRDPRTLIMDSIVADLDYAGQHITSINDNTRSTVTKWVVYAFKSRMCLFEGTFRKYQKDLNLASTADQYLRLAADAADSVMQSGMYSLNNGNDSLSYRNLFISTAPVASEVMLADVTSESLGKYNDANWYYTSATYGPRFSFTRLFINTYLKIDGTPFTDTPGYDTMQFAHEVQNRDWRLQQTIRMAPYKRTTNGNQIATPPVFSYTYTGYMPIKWTLDDTKYDNSATNINAVPLMRYAEVLLNYAEAKAELGTITDADWAKTIGALRARAGIKGGLTSLPTKADAYLQTNYFPDISDPAILEVRRERGIELALEGLRFYDLVRWNHGDLLLKPWNGMYVPKLNTPMDLNNDGVKDVFFYTNAKDTAGAGKVTLINVAADPQKLSNGTYGELHWLDNVSRTWQSYMRFYPIPYSDLQINPALKQNPDWQ